MGLLRVKRPKSGEEQIISLKVTDNRHIHLGVNVTLLVTWNTHEWDAMPLTICPLFEKVNRRNRKAERQKAARAEPCHRTNCKLIG